MTKILLPIRALRENLRLIGAAVNASREYSSATTGTADARMPSSGIPL